MHKYMYLALILLTLVIVYCLTTQTQAGGYPVGGPTPASGPADSALCGNLPGQYIRPSDSIGYNSYNPDEWFRAESGPGECYPEERQPYSLPKRGPRQHHLPGQYISATGSTGYDTYNPNEYFIGSRSESFLGELTPINIFSQMWSRDLQRLLLDANRYNYNSQRVWDLYFVPKQVILPRLLLSNFHYLASVRTERNKVALYLIPSDDGLINADSLWDRLDRNDSKLVQTYCLRDAEQTKELVRTQGRLGMRYLLSQTINWGQDTHKLVRMNANELSAGLAEHAVNNFVIAQQIPDNMLRVEPVTSTYNSWTKRVEPGRSLRVGAGYGVGALYYLVIVKAPTVPALNGAFMFHDGLAMYTSQRYSAVSTDLESVLPMVPKPQTDHQLPTRVSELPLDDASIHHKVMAVLEQIYRNTRPLQETFLPAGLQLQVYEALFLLTETGPRFYSLRPPVLTARLNTEKTFKSHVLGGLIKSIHKEVALDQVGFIRLAT